MDNHTAQTAHELSQQEIYELLADYLIIIWRGISADFKRTYVRDVWRIFEDNIRSAAAHTNQLTRFHDTLTKRLNVHAGGNADDRKRLQHVLELGLDRLLLRVLRDEPSYVVLNVHLRDDELRKQYQEQIEEIQQLEFGEMKYGAES